MSLSPKKEWFTIPSKTLIAKLAIVTTSISMMSFYNHPFSHRRPMFGAVITKIENSLSWQMEIGSSSPIDTHHKWYFLFTTINQNNLDPNCLIHGAIITSLEAFSYTTKRCWLLEPAVSVSSACYSKNFSSLNLFLRRPWTICNKYNAAMLSEAMRSLKCSLKLIFNTKRPYFWARWIDRSWRKGGMPL